MSEIGSRGPENPFSPSAIAKITIDGEAPVTLRTEAVEEALRHVTAYLTPVAGERQDVRPDGLPESGRRSRRRGFILAIVGDYGTGKTHLVVQLLRRAKATSVGDAANPLVVHYGYLEAMSGSFDRMYRDFVAGVDREDVLSAVRDHYRDVVADALARSPLTEDTARRLRNRELDPDRVVEGLGLIDSMLSRQLREELIDITETEAFGVALSMLLLRKEFADDVWAWLTGDPPTPALVDRGIVTTISGDELVLEAMGVFAHLYGRRHHRFLLVIDELDKVFTGERWARENAAALFKKLFEIFQAAGACLVAVGLPDLIDVLGKAGQERIAYTVYMPPFSGDDVRKLISLTHRRAFGRDTIEPFDPTVPDLIAKLANGSARQVIRLCHRAYEAIKDTNGAITDDTVRQVASARENLPSLARARRHVRAALRSRGLPFQTDYLPPQGVEPVDFWVSLGHGGIGCAVVLAPSIVTEQDAERLIRLARIVRGAGGGSAALLVVVGYLHSDLRRSLVDAFDSDPVEPLWQDLRAEFGSALDEILTRLRDSAAGDTPSLLMERIGWISQQQSYSQTYLERLALQVEEVRATLRHQWTATRHEPLQSGAEAARHRRLPSAVDEVFDGTTDVLDMVDWMDSAMREALDAYDDPTALVAHQRGLRTRLASTSGYAAVGVASLMRSLVESFRAGVATWYERYSSGDVPDPAADEALSMLCQTYESIYYDLQRSLLEDYPVPPTRAEAIDEETDYLAWTSRTVRVSQSLDNLGMQVHAAVKRSISGSAGA